MSFVNKVKGFLLVPSKTFEESKGDTLKEAMNYYVRLAAIFSAIFAFFSVFRQYLLFYSCMSPIGDFCRKMWVFTNMGVDSFDIRFISSLINIHPKSLNGLEVYLFLIIYVIEAFILFLILMIIGIFISGAIFHIFVHFFGGKKDITQTIKALMYGQTPGILLMLLSMMFIGGIALMYGETKELFVLLTGLMLIVNIIAGVWSLILMIIGIRNFHQMSNKKAIIAVLITIVVSSIIGKMFTMIITYMKMF